MYSLTMAHIILTMSAKFLQFWDNETRMRFNVWIDVYSNCINILVVKIGKKWIYGKCH